MRQKSDELRTDRIVESEIAAANHDTATKGGNKLI